jgi:hypothetical protein
MKWRTRDNGYAAKNTKDTKELASGRRRKVNDEGQMTNDEF